MPQAVMPYAVFFTPRTNTYTPGKIFLMSLLEYHLFTWSGGKSIFETKILTFRKSFVDMNVLIVDDSDLLKNRLKKTLTEFNKTINISLASNCKEAMDMFTLHLYDKIILDIDLPDGSGINLLRIFKKTKPETDVIMFTNYPSSEFKKNCIQLGADHFFTKSDMASLIKIIV